MKIISWIGTISSIVGSFTVALQSLMLGYTLFLVGSVSWLYVAIRQKNMSLGVLNATFLCANILGLYKALF